MNGDWVVRAGFLGHAQPGDRIQMTYGKPDAFLVTGRADSTATRDGDGSIVVVAGVDDDGQPRHEMGAGWRPVLFHHLATKVAVPDHIDSEGGQPCPQGK